MFAALAFAALAAADPTAGEIMQRVAENQERALEARKRWSYHQYVQTRLFRGDGTLARRDDREYFVIPGEKVSERKLLKVTGEVRDGQKRTGFSAPGFRVNGHDVDGEICDDLSDDFLGHRESRDGVDPALFPLTARKLARYRFELRGRERYQDRDVYRVLFKPLHEDEAWEGEALIDVQEYQPAVVTTKLAKGIPLAAKVLLGTNLHNLGFKIVYKKLEDGVWFPASYGTEFRVRVLFFFSRKIVFGMRNEEFRRTDVTSSITLADNK